MADQPQAFGALRHNASVPSIVRRQPCEPIGLPVDYNGQIINSQNCAVSLFSAAIERSPRRESRIFEFSHIIVRMHDAGRLRKRDRERLTKLASSGVPAQFRAEVWRIYLGVEQIDVKTLDSEYYRLQGLELSCYCELEIEADIARTLPYILSFYQKAQRSRLHRILRAYAAIDRQLYYCQGMNCVAGLLLCFMDEQSAFQCFLAFMKRFGFLFALQSRQYNQFYGMVRESLERCSRDAHAYLTLLNVDLQLFVLSWVASCFTQALHFGVALRVFDYVLASGVQGMCRVCVALIVHASRGVRFDYSGVQLNSEAHEAQFAEFAAGLSGRRRAGGVSFIGMPLSDLLPHIQRTGFSILDADEFIADSERLPLFLDMREVPRPRGTQCQFSL